MTEYLLRSKFLLMKTAAIATLLHSRRAAGAITSG